VATNASAQEMENAGFPRVIVDVDAPVNAVLSVVLQWGAGMYNIDNLSLQFYPDCFSTNCTSRGADMTSTFSTSAAEIGNGRSYGVYASFPSYLGDVPAAHATSFGAGIRFEATTAVTGV